MACCFSLASKAGEVLALGLGMACKVVFASVRQTIICVEADVTRHAPNNCILNGILIIAMMKKVKK